MPTKPQKPDPEMTSPEAAGPHACRRYSVVPLLLAAVLGAGTSFAADPQALFERYCYDCHGDGLSKGGVSIEKLLEAGDSSDHRHDWLSAWKIVRHELMPPADEDQPTPEERQAIVRWIEDARFGVDRENPDPGRVTIRRLNRMEYEHSIQDLFGTEISMEETFSSDASVARTRLRDMLPPDDTAFGFDNIGDFQTMSPALLEKYFNIAEFVVGHVVSTEGPQVPIQNINRPPDVSRQDEGKVTEHTVDFEVEYPGRYEVEVRFNLGGWIEFGGAFDYTMEVDGQEVAKEEIEVGGQKTHRYNPEVGLEPGKKVIRLVTRAIKPDSTGALVHLQLRPRIEIRGPLDGDIRAYPAPHRRIFFNGDAPQDPAEREAYAREILGRIATRAFRRPVDDSRLDALTEMAMRHDVFEKGVSRALTAILSSPRFLFRAETQPQPDDPETQHPLDEHSLASRLSYLLWLSLPDQELLALADAGKLRENLRDQVQRMLADERSKRFFEDFPGQWLRTRNVLMTPIARVDRIVNPLRESMKRETEMLLEHIARQDRDLVELVTADYTFVDKPLADYYGLKHPGGGFQRVELGPETRRGGILTHGSFLVSTSNPNRTSPVKRGLFVLENLLAAEPPPPPPDTPALEEPPMRGQPTKTVRDQLVAHRADKNCAACHAHFDPIGLALENYDLIGSWRDTEIGEPIQPDEVTTTGQRLTGIADLRDFFASRKDRFYRCAAEKLLTYALGRGLDPLDAPVVDGITEAMMRDGGKFSTLLYGVIESPQFQYRRGDDGVSRENPRNAIPEPPPPEQRRGSRRMRDMLQRQAAGEAGPPGNDPFPGRPPVEAAPPALAPPAPTPESP